MNDKQKLLEMKTEAYADGKRHGYQEGYAVAAAALETIKEVSFENGRRFERERLENADWRKFFTYEVLASTIGCGIVLAIAVGLSNIPGL